MYKKETLEKQNGKAPIQRYHLSSSATRLSTDVVIYGRDDRQRLFPQRVTPVCRIDFATNGNGTSNSRIRGPVPTMSKSYGIYIYRSREGARKRERETGIPNGGEKVGRVYRPSSLNSPFSDEIQSSTYYASVYVCRDFQFQPTQYTDPPMQPSIVHMVSCIQYERNCIREGAPSLSLFLCLSLYFRLHTACASFSP